MAGDLRVTVKGLDETVAALKASSQQLAKEQRRSYKLVAERVSDWLRAGARQGTRAERRFADAFQGRSTSRAARIAVRSRAGFGGAAPTFFGALDNSGWYAGWRDGKKDPQRAAGFYGTPRQRQHPEWIGANWRLGVPGEGPYVVRRVIPARMDDIADLLADAQVKALRGVFPEGGSK